MTVMTGSSYSYNGDDKVLDMPVRREFVKTQVKGYESFDWRDCYEKLPNGRDICSILLRTTTTAAMTCFLMTNCGSVPDWGKVPNTCLPCKVPTVMNFMETVSLNGTMGLTMDAV